ncbi:nucleotidyltransferase family protein [Thermomonospora umbrina]|uniref:Putative nucleotidyltransferase-like protein n=1 Tax=Thermomonospora umbrina TaxID=111806 RepID=A0A3D9SUF9_9ACTN|nr:nucleotidyltransferase [Thermomonospora umbrina]REE96625.1 putative nucleotidyltransferase-like protein [Thermomonospora umbrina]
MTDGGSSAGEETLLTSLKRAAGAMKEAGVGFALAGGFAAYARGAAISTHDVDFVVRERDLQAALDALTGAGMRRRECPEDWLEKVYDDDRLIDLIFRPSGRAVDDGMLARADELSVAAVNMPVLPADDLVVMRLLAYSETACDFSDFLHVCRALREQVDWPKVAKETEHSPYAYAFLTLLDRLDVIEGGFL